MHTGWLMNEMHPHSIYSYALLSSNFENDKQTVVLAVECKYTE